jgi:hypothetical protein
VWTVSECEGDAFYSALAQESKTPSDEVGAAPGEKCGEACT